MSQVTNVMLQFSGTDGDEYASVEFDTDFKNLDLVQAIVAEMGDGRKFKYIAGCDDRERKDQAELRYSANYYWGGSKVPETTLLAGAFNYLSLDGFIAELEKLTWNEPEAFRLFVQEQDANAFGVWVMDDSGKIVNRVAQWIE